MSDDEMSVALLESLQRANPVRADEVANRRDLPSAHALLAEITAQRPRRVRRRTVVVVIALVVLALAALVGFALVNESEPDATAPPLCYESVSLDARHVVAATGDLRTACGSLWERGDFGTGAVPSHFDVCVLPTGAPAVFPAESGSVCKQLGLRQARLTGSDDRLREFEQQAGPAVGGPGHCAGFGEARDIVERYLDKFGFDGWSVELQRDAVPFSAENPCASIAVVPEQQTVFIVPGPPIVVVPPPTS